MKFNILKSFVNDYNEKKGMLNELNWANVYHDSITDKPWLQSLSLNIGRWAGGYSFFYILNRVLNDIKPSKILEFGLGESSKFISTYIVNSLQETDHIIVEHDEEWVKNFNARFALSNKSKIILKHLVKKKIKGYEVVTYGSLASEMDNDIQLYIVDGPFGSDRFSRYDIIDLLNQKQNFGNFIIIFDDVDRLGEQDTVVEIFSLLESKKVNYHTGLYKGEKWQRVIVCEKFKWLTTL